MKTRTVPGFVNVLGTATNTATVSLWSKDSTALFTPTTRNGDYFRGEMPFNNATGAMWLTITNVSAISNSSSADIVTNFIGSSLLAKTPEAFLYDADGNLTNDSLWAYTWDAENRLIKQESISDLPVAGKRRLDFEYDHQSRRIQKLVSTNNGSTYVAQSTNRFVYDGWNLVATLNPQSSILQSFVWGLDLSGSLQGPGGVGGLLMLTDQATINGQPSTHFVSYTGNGNVAALVAAASGAVSATYEYGPFSEVVRQTGPMAKANKFRFSTKYQDDESDYLYYGYRSYNPSSGRWLNRDPIGDIAFLRRAVDGKSFEEIGRLFNEALKSSYRFVGNNPISMFDPNGLEQIEIDMYTEILTSVYLGTAGVKTTHAVTIDTDTQKIVSEYKENGKTWSLNGTATLTATASGNSKSMTVTLTGTAQNGVGAGPSIDYTMTIDLTLCSRGKVTKATLKGAHDGFPTYYMFFKGNEVYRRKEGFIGSLLGTSDIKVGPKTIYP